MTSQLRDELARMGDDAPRLDLPDDLWARGRRARRQTRVLAAGAAACLALATLGVTTAVVGRAPLPQPAARPPSAPAVPRTLYPVPVHVQHDEPLESPVFAVDRAAAAFVTRDGVPVLVDAADGSHLPVRLPGWQGVSDGAPSVLGLAGARPLAVSPDGRSLAWVWATPSDDPGGDETRSGVSVVDLQDGTVLRRPVRALPGDRAVDVRSVTWSPDGRWVGWSGLSVGSDASEGRGVLGELEVRESGLASTITAASPDFSLTTTDDGTLVEANRSGTVVLHGVGGGTSEFSVGRRGLDAAQVGAATPDGRRIALSVSGAQAPYLVIDLEARRLEHRDPPVGSPFGHVTPLAWLDEDTVVLANEGDWRHVSGAKITSTPTTSREAFRDRTFARFEPAATSGESPMYLTLATDLVSLDRLSVERPAPEWPWSPERRVVVGAVSGAVLLVGLALLLLRRRRLG